MGLLEKLKNTFFEEEYVEVEEEEPKKVKKESKKESKREEIQVARKVNEVEKIEEKNEKLEISQEMARENVEEPEIQADTELLKSDNPLPYFEDDDFVDTEEVYVPPKVEETKKLYGGDPSRIYQNVEFDAVGDTKPYATSKEGKSKFQPTPIISPIYGILDKNYKKEEVVDKKDRPSSYVSRKNVDLDFVRNKAFGTVEEEPEKEEVQVEETVPNFIPDNEEYENSLLYDMTDTGTPSVDKVTLADAEEYFEDLGLEYNVDYKDVRYEKATGRRSRITKEEVSNEKEEPKKNKRDSKNIEEEVKLEDNLFDLVDSMYEGKEED